MTYLRSFLAVAIGGMIFIASLSGCTKKTGNASKTLTSVLSSAPRTLDPASTTDIYSSKLIASLYEGLVQYHYLKRPYVLQPNLLRSMPTVSSEGRVYRFELKKGVRFHDDDCFPGGKGRELVAQDVAYTFMRMADPHHHFASSRVVESRIVGFPEWIADAKKTGRANYDQAISGLRIKGPHTLEVRLTAPYPTFLHQLAIPNSFVVAREAVEKYGMEFNRHPVGTGPFILDRHSSNFKTKMVLLKNPHYRDSRYPTEGNPGDQEKGFLDFAGEKLPFLDRVVIDIITEPQTRWLNFMAGKLDRAGIPKDQFSSAFTPSNEFTPEMKAKKIRLDISDRADVVGTIFNFKDPILGKNKKVRQAISLAYGAETLIRDFYGSKAIPAMSIIPPGLPSYDPTFTNPYRVWNIERAKKLLAEAGYPQGKGLPEFQLHILNNSFGRQEGEYFRRQMAAIGVRIRPVTVTWVQLVEDAKKSKGQLYSYAWVSDYPDAENNLQLFYSKNVAPGSNYANYQNPKFDRLFETLRVTTDRSKRVKLIRQMRDLLVEDCPWVWMVHRQGYILTQDRFLNYRYSNFKKSAFKYYFTK